MSSYSLGGYKIAVRIRTKKTILVEGKDDKIFIDRLRSELKKESLFEVDSVDLLTDGALSGLGARQKLDFILNQIQSNPIFISKIKVFADREWEGLIDTSSNEISPWSEPTQTPIRLLTTGHSIENYSFNRDCILNYLEHFGGVINENTRGAVIDILPKALSFAGAFSDVARKRNIISKCGNILELSHINIATDISLLPAIDASLTSRGAEMSAPFSSEVNLAHASQWRQADYFDYASFLAHGHMGEMCIWVILAKVLEQNGIASQICEEIAHGRKEERKRYWMNLVVKMPDERREPTSQIFS